MANIFTGKDDAVVFPGQPGYGAEPDPSKVQWSVRGHGRDAQAIAFCPVCKLQTEFTNVSLNAQFQHCGRRDRMPEKVYEQYCLLRENDGRPRIPEREFRIRWI